MPFRTKIARYVLAASAVFCLVSSAPAYAESTGQSRNFFVDSNYDQYGRTSLTATLRSVSEHAYFYLDDTYWNSLSSFQRDSIGQSMEALGRKFDNVYYPTETTVWGSEPNPGIDGDSRVTILLESLQPGNGGYFATVNGYSRINAQNSNEREMITISAYALGSGAGEVFLAHEFQHLISFNQKELKHNISEEIWLNEARSQYSETLVGNNRPYASSDLERRSNAFLLVPGDSLTEWPNTSTDYAIATVFAEYLGGRFGQGILAESLRSASTGINSINEYLQRRQIGETFEDVFADWMLASAINDPASSRYGYANSDLRWLKVQPQYHVILSSGQQYFWTTAVKNWQAYWYEYVLSGPLPPSQVVKFDMSGSPGQNFILPFAVMYDDGTYEAGKANITSGGKVLYFADPDPTGGTQKKIVRIVAAVTAGQKVRDFAGNEPAFNFTLNASSTDRAASGQSVASFAPPSAGAGLRDGTLIKRNNGESEMYVITGKYKRYLSPAVILLYGQLDASKAVPVADDVFNSYTTANYVRSDSDKKVYAVWPDGTKHWLNMTGEYFTSSGRDWNAIFVINDLEFNYYQTGVDIKR